MPFSSDQIIFLINPNSGQGKHKEIVTAIQKTNSSISYYICKSKAELEQFFASLNNKIKVVVICGGDGTVNSVLEYAINTDIVFAVLPTGSGNGFAREMGYTKDINGMLAILQKGETRKIDVVKVNDNYCCNIAGIGFDSFIARQFDKNGKRGLITYVFEALKGVFKYQCIHAKVVADDIELEGNYFMLTVANTRQFGNNVLIAPKALPDDGLLDLVIIKRFPKIKLPLIVIKLLNKESINSKYIQYLRARKITIETDFDFYHTDGEPQEKTQFYIFGQHRNDNRCN